MPAIRGIEFTAGTPVLIDATAAGYSPPTNKLQVSVVNGVIRFCDLETSREIGAERDEATVCAGVQSGSTHPEVPSVNWLLSLSLSNPTPPGIVAGLFNQAVGGSQITQLFWGANSTSSAPSFVGSPTTNGTYQVSAFMTTGASALSDVVNVGVATGPFRIKRHELNTLHGTWV